MYVVFNLMSVLVAILFSETIGQHLVLGPLALGLVVPDGPTLGAALASKLDTLVSGSLYPTYLTDSGLKTNIFRINLQSLWIVGFIVLFASLVKIGAVMLIAHYNKIHFREALVLGLMLNARGVCELIVYNLWSSEILTQQEFTLAVLSVIAVTPSKQHIPIQRRTIQHAKREAELRILVCIHNQDNVTSIINLLEASNATEKSPVAVIAVPLVELVGRATPILIAHQPQEKSDTKSYHIINALQHYELYNEGCATVQSFGCISRYNRMHDDICQVAPDENANIVIITFHKNWAIDGTIDSVNRSIRALNLNVLNRAPCSVGIFIDRGVLRGSLSIISSQSIYNVLVIYIGGADGGEALSYSARMAKHENVTVTVMRLLLFRSDSARERKLDNDSIDEVCYANIGNKGFLYREEVVRDGVGLASSITGFENGYDLFIVGRSHRGSPFLSGLDAWSECTELGVIGDMLASTDFGSTSSVLNFKSNNELLMKNHQSHPTGSVPFPKVNVSSFHGHGRGRGCGRIGGRGHGRNRKKYNNRGDHNSLLVPRRNFTPSYQKWNSNATKQAKGKALQNKLRRYTMTSLAIVDITNLNISNFFADPSDNIDHLIADGNIHTN
ncbi:cation/H(+) antiporter 15-like [Cornus florida]|uniref:cation/H(+) antiporter 15-like n=1 Tax=Cornus florida TaxID=4283 RepID=UPI00289FB530|nr:cation/H(+) antiporter 15-like [Cornus florida]